MRVFEAPKKEDDRLNIIRAKVVKEMFPDAQCGPDFIQAINNAVYILLQRANDRRRAHRRTRFYDVDV